MLANIASNNNGKNCFELLVVRFAALTALNCLLFGLQLNNFWIANLRFYDEHIQRKSPFGVLIDVTLNFV